MRSPLRDLTSAEHGRVDRLFSRFDLSQRSGYRPFLAAQASAHLAIESALDRAGAARLVPDWPQRRRGNALRLDLTDLSIEPHVVDGPAFPTPDSVLGGIYVLEGSRLGGAVLASQLAEDQPARFLAARSRPGAWRDLLILLGERLADPKAMDDAAAAARACFNLFEQSATRELEATFA